MKKIKLVKKDDFDFQFFIAFLCLLLIGFVMLFSSSMESARANYGDSLYFIKRQVIWAILGGIAMFFMARIKLSFVKRSSNVLMIISIILLIAVLLIGTNLNGGKRWIVIAGFSFQPSELMKIAIVIFFASLLSIPENVKKIKFFWRKGGLFVYLLLVGFIGALLLLEPHLSVTIIIILLSASMLIAGGAQIKHFFWMLVPAVAGVAGLIAWEPYRMKRFTTFINPFADKLGEGWQIIQSLYAIGSGGLFGLGPFQSRQKFLYIPEPQNDFIFSIVCEELGWIWASAIILLFAFLIWRGIKIALSAPTRFQSLTAFGIMALIAWEVILNIAVITSSVPNTGIPLPFFSSGGTTLFINMAAMGLVLNISRKADVT